MTAQEPQVAGGYHDGRQDNRTFSSSRKSPPDDASPEKMASPLATGLPDQEASSGGAGPDGNLLHNLTS